MAPRMHGGAEMPPNGGRYLLSWRYVTGVLRAHLAFVLRAEYPKLAFAAVGGRAMKLVATLCGAPVVTPLYRCFVNPDYRRTNVMYDKLSPFLRHWFVRLAGPYHVDSVTALVAWERRGAVLLEFLFVLLQIVLFFSPAALLVVTVAGVFLNAVPRQFYAQLKLMIRALHITYMDTTAERLLATVPPERRAKTTYDGRRVFGPDRRETPKEYLAFRGNHHSGCWAVVRTEAIDFSLSFVGGLLMVYLLVFTALVGLDLIGAADRDGRLGSAFPFWAVTVARFAKSACNFGTTENLVHSIAARQSQHELYFLQRLVAVRQQFPRPADLVRAAAVEHRCARSELAFVGRPCLRSRASPPEAPLHAAAPELSMFNFLSNERHTAESFQRVLDDSVWAGCSSQADTLTRREDGTFPTPFNAQKDLDDLRGYGESLLWAVFDVDHHEVCEPEAAAHEHPLASCHDAGHDHAHPAPPLEPQSSRDVLLEGGAEAVEV